MYGTYLAIMLKYYSDKERFALNKIGGGARYNKLSCDVL